MELKSASNCIFIVSVYIIIFLFLYVEHNLFLFVQ